MTKPSYEGQLMTGAEALTSGHTATLQVPGYAVTGYVRAVDGEGSSRVYATWYRDHLTSTITPGQVFALPAGSEYRVLTTAYALLETHIVATL